MSCLYSSEPLKSDTEITGPVTVDLWASSSAPDTDFTAKLDVVKPDGEVVNLNNGIVRSVSDQAAEPAGRPRRIPDIHLADQLSVPCG